MTPGPVWQPILTRRHYRWLALGFLLLVLYGCLVPFELRWLPLAEVVERYRQALAGPARVASRSDWAANILLFVPLGFLLPAGLSADRSRLARWAAVLAALPVCGLLALALEFLQVYFPPRVASLNDVVAQGLGAVLGSGLWLVLGQPATERVRALWAGLGDRKRAPAALLTLYLVFLALAQLLPLDLTLSPAELYHKYRAGRVQLVPFARGPGGGLDRVQKHLTNFALFVPVGVLLASLRWQRRPSLLGVAFVGVGVAGVLEVGQLFVYSRYCAVTDVITGGLAAAAGWWTWRGYERRWAGEAGGAAPGRGSRPKGRAGLLPLLGWLALLIFVSWQPFAFRFSPARALDRLEEISLLPLADYFQQNYLHALDQLVSKVALFLPLGVFLALARPDSGGWRAGAVFAVAVLVAVVLESGQLFLESRYPGVTDVLVGACAIVLGHALGRRIRARADRAEPALKPSP